MKVIQTKDAVGKILFHDLTQIIPGKSKSARFKRGHVIKEEDIEVLLSMGKEHVYVYELDDTHYHEEDAARILAGICAGENIRLSDVSEGRINLISEIDGLLKVNVKLLHTINSMPDVMIATKYNDSVIKEGDVLAGTRAIPLIIKKEKIKNCLDSAQGEHILKVLPYKKQRVGIITTGSEVFSGKIKDGFKEVLTEKLLPFDFEIIHHSYSKDDIDSILTEIRAADKKNCDLILCTGGMSVDPDDLTPGAIKAYADHVVSYGTPVLPGAMFLVAHKNRTAVLGLPGSIIFNKKTVFDLILPKIAAGEIITKEYLISLGHGGLL
ncbi:molybdenum cofactor biosynthesis protein MoaB [Treponema phagedenis]|uniref:Molybdopterin molybdenumtransferase n=1 Tax=Treponema phagedenis TaxID=162 RepID=A0A0B7GRB2_TREPH|nr:molybdopterin-binding protein [Treponema phagedenis]EFW37462.1 molybdopterin binding domain protein [Treponema phagedenis F0421]NVP24780.1 molybdopterin-binding protein [Treponema phagedenis]QEJ95890.1 molybdopterin-binding protein [Treponema phagedenis]QEJ98894.1 molybdopterin-binding protein [Treponema phagedenis]QEK00412.1 molybdopterin-binding protein [Treponema phagedenis]